MADFVDTIYILDTTTDSIHRYEARRNDKLQTVLKKFCSDKGYQRTKSTFHLGDTFVNGDETYIELRLHPLATIYYTTKIFIRLLVKSCIYNKTQVFKVNEDYEDIYKNQSRHLRLLSHTNTSLTYLL